MLCLLKTLKEEAITSIRTIDLTKNAEDVKALTALLKSQLNMASTFIELPNVIQETRKQLEARQTQIDRVMKAAEDTGIHEVGGV